MTAPDIDGLVERLAALTKPDTWLDFEIQQAVEGWRNLGGGYREFKDGRRERYHFSGAPRFTESIDAALTLVNPGAGLSLERYWKWDGEAWTATIRTGGVPGIPLREFSADAKTAAGALSSAALRARAQADEAER